MKSSRTAIITLSFLLFALPAPGQNRTATIGAGVEPFTLADIDGDAFSYASVPGRVSVLAFVAAHQKRSERTINTLSTLTTRLRRSAHPVDLLFIVSGGKDAEYFREWRLASGHEPSMLVDTEDELWGRLGVIVTPTTFVVDKDGSISWIRAGHSFDYVGAVDSAIRLALGLDVLPEPADAAPAAPSAEDVGAQARRHARVGRIYAQRGELEAALAEVGKATALAPDDTGIRLDRARLLCRAARPAEALAALVEIRPASTNEEAQMKTLSGWAHRQLGDVDRALTLLTDAISLDPDAVRAQYELGKVLQQRGDVEQAMAAYRSALARHFGD